MAEAVPPGTALLARRPVVAVAVVAVRWLGAARYCLWPAGLAGQAPSTLPVVAERLAHPPAHPKLVKAAPKLPVANRGSLGAPQPHQRLRARLERAGVD